jgi:hypothetical protein
MGFWHTGYFEFHEPTGLGQAYQPIKMVYPCQHCGKNFETLDELRRHRFEMHAYSRPLLFVCGAELGATPFRVTKHLTREDVYLDRATSATFNGETVKPSELASRIALVKNDRIQIELANDGASAKFELNIQISSEDHLAGVEAAFIKMARARSLGIPAIEGFIADCKSFDTAAVYCDGICHYLYGVLAKERSGDTALTFDEYRERYSRAANELLGFERPLARIVRALIAFHFNHFEDAQNLAPPGRLQHASVLFAGLLEGWPWHHESEIISGDSGALVDLLTDHETLRILRWTEFGSKKLVGCVADIAAQVKRDIPGYDRLKLQLMLAEALATQGNIVGAERAARELTGNALTTKWAETLLTRLSAKDTTI